MNNSALVWWILGPFFAAVGLYLIWYSNRRKKMLERFARSHQLKIRPEHVVVLQKTLDSCFSTRHENMVRSFDQISSPIDGGSVWLFKAVELVDLNPYAQSYSTHFSRIGALFTVPEKQEEWFNLDKSMQAKPRLPGADRPGSEVAEITRRIAAACRARHALSVSLSGGYCLIYFEPLVTGGETIEDVDSLYCIAKDMHRELTGNG